MNTSWKTVRVFISSTFRDMQAERDWLVRFVFPRLREELVKYRIHFVDVDLRWGVTSDQNALGVCREVIDECHPRFMCMLGGRYGWVPDGQDKSITADEIHYGVLGRETELRGRAFFYFRDDNATAQMVEETPGDFREADGSDSARKLAALKMSVSDAGLPFFIYDAQWDAAQKRLTGIEAFGNKVHEDLLQDLKNDPELAARFITDNAAQADEFAEEAEQMEAFIEERAERIVIGSREPLLREMTAFACADGTPNIFVLTGDSGSGKSALLAKFTRDLTALKPPPFVIPHFIGASTGSTDLRRTLRRFCHELALAAGNTESLPLDIKDLITHFQKLLTEAASKQSVILIFDALNQLDTTDGAHWMNWLPRELPPGVRIVASVIAPADGQPEHQTLAILRARPGTRLEKLEPLTEADTLAVIEGSLRRYAKRLSPEQIAALLAKPAGRLPLYVLTALEELRTLGTYEEITERIRTLPGDTRALFGWILTERLARDPGFRDREGRPCGAALVEKFATSLGVSRHGLSPAELTALLDPGDPQGNVAALLRLLRPYLMRRGELLDFYHGQFREAADAAHLATPEKERAAHQSVATCLQAFADPHIDGQCRDATPHALSELPHHQTRAEAWHDLIATLENIFFLEAKVTHGMAFDLVMDFTATIAALPQEHSERNRLSLMNEALRRDIHFIARHAEDYPQALFQCLWNSCWWSDCPEVANHYNDETFPRRQVGIPLYELLELWRLQKEQTYPGFIWLRSCRPPFVGLGRGMLASLSGHTGGITSVAISPDGEILASGSWDQTVRLWDIGSGKEKFTLLGHRGPVNCLAISPDGRTIATAGEDHTVRLWDIASGREMHTLKAHAAQVSTICFSPDGKSIAIGGSDSTVRLLDIESRCEMYVLSSHGTIYNNCVCFSPDGLTVAYSSKRNRIALWSERTGSEITTLVGNWTGIDTLLRGEDSHLLSVNALAFHPSGRILASGAGNYVSGEIKLWDMASAKEIAVLSHGDLSVRAVAFSSDGMLLVGLAEDGTIKLWRVTSERKNGIMLRIRELGVLAPNESCLSFSPDGSKLASGGMDNTVRIWDAEAVKKKRALINHWDEVLCMAFSSDGSMCATGGSDCLIKVWDSTSGKQLVELYGHLADVTYIAFSLEGGGIISYGNDRTLRLWDLASGTCIDTRKDFRKNYTDMPRDWPPLNPTGAEATLQSDIHGDETIIVLSKTECPIAFYPVNLLRMNRDTHERHVAGVGDSTFHVHLLEVNGSVLIDSRKYH